MNKILAGVLLSALLLIAGVVIGYGLAERRARWAPASGPYGWPTSVDRYTGEIYVHPMQQN